MASMDVEYHHCLINGALFDHNENDSLKDSRISVAPGQVICLVSINVTNQLPVKAASDPVSITPLPEIILKTSELSSSVCPAGDYMAGVSDDGRWFIWEKRTGRSIKMLLGDEAGSFLSPCDSVWFMLFFTSLHFYLLNFRMLPLHTIQLNSMKFLS
ncbi:hypothetical protein NC652_006172 [Populus alba x Populus x berolinensis]|nr:hypothetical protein NC652_006172 [Populus alba x Populus x berolinensis]